MNYLHKVRHFLAFKDKLSKFYLMISFKSFAFSMFQLFLPIFIYTLRNSFTDVLLFVFLQYVFSAIFFPVAGKICYKIGNAHTILLSTPLYALFFGLVYFLNPLNIGIWLLGILFGVAGAFFWAGFHEEFSSISKSKKLGKEFGWTRGLSLAAGAIGPTLGGIILLSYDFNVLFLLSMIILIIGQIPLLFKDIKPRQGFKLKKLWNFKNYPYFLPLVGYGAMTTTMIWLWPLLVFLILGNYLEMGVLGTIVSSVATAMVIFLGYRADKKNKLNLILFGAIAFPIILLLRPFVSNLFQISLIWILGAFLWPILNVSFDSFIYKKSKKFHKLEYFSMRENSLLVGRLIVLGITFGVFYFTQDIQISLGVSMIIGGLGGFLLRSVKNR